jgi:hypothetical protein
VTARQGILFPACLALALALCGCGSPAKNEDRGTASSLVYSPAARLPAGERPAGNPGGDTNSSTAGAADDPVRPPAGRVCRIHLRREALGVAGQVPYALGGGNNISADRVQVTGTLERVGRDWLVLRTDRSTYWIPRDVVLAVEFADER